MNTSLANKTSDPINVDLTQNDQKWTQSHKLRLKQARYEPGKHGPDLTHKDHFKVHRSVNKSELNREKRMEDLKRNQRLLPPYLSQVKASVKTGFLRRHQSMSSLPTNQLQLQNDEYFSRDSTTNE